MVETKPHFYEWATVQPGMICVARKKRTAVFRQYVAAETAIPVIACAACKGKDEASDYFFAGVARSKSVRAPDDGIGPSVDEFFTVSLGGMSTVLNTSGAPLSPGDNVEWTFFTERGTSTGKRQKSGPRRIGVQLCSVSSPRAIGRVLTFAKAGEPFDVRRPNTNPPPFRPPPAIPLHSHSSISRYSCSSSSKNWVKGVCGRVRGVV